MGLAAVLAMTGCTGDESAAASPLPTLTPVATVETPMATATATTVPTATPTVEPRATTEPSPTATPTGEELYGPLLIEGSYDWPQQMPDDLTDDELFAINIFASAQNASFAAIEAQSLDLHEFVMVREHVVSEITDNVRRAIALDIESGVSQRFPADGLTAFISVSRSGVQGDALVLQTCEYIDSSLVLADGSGQDGENFTVRRDIRFGRSGGGVVYESWKIAESSDGLRPACGT